MFLKTTGELGSFELDDDLNDIL